MKLFSDNQLQQLKNHSQHIDDSAAVTRLNLHHLFDDSTKNDFMNVLKYITKSENNTVALSYFTKRYGLFISMQVVLLIESDMMWNGPSDALQFDIREEYGNESLCMHTKSAHWGKIDSSKRREAITQLLTEQCFAVINELRKIGQPSSLTHWENIFGYILWQFHSFLSEPSFSKKAAEYMTYFEEKESWLSIADYSIFKRYTGGGHPSTLIQSPLRKTCCFSKDVSGLMQCGFCPFIHVEK